MALAAPPTRRHRPEPRHAMPPALLLLLPDELLKDIFLRLDAADLARASGSCASLRRIISSCGFLRRFRSIHHTPILGFLHCSNVSAGAEFYQAQPPRKWAPAARALAQAADFTFSFLDDPICLRVLDARDGRVLLARKTATFHVFEDFVVCDPLHRQYVKIPPSPAGDLNELFLAPDVWEEEEPSLRVFCNVAANTEVVTFCFSSAIGTWQPVASVRIVACGCMQYPMLMKRHYCVHGCFCWTDYKQSVMLVLDTLEMKFSVVKLPPEISSEHYISIVEAADGRLGLLIRRDFEFHLYSKTMRDNGVDAEEWRHDHTIPSPNCCRSTFNVYAAEGYVVLRGTPRDQCNSENPYGINSDVQYFTLQIKTLLLERLCVEKCKTSANYLYATFPPPLSPPSI